MKQLENSSENNLKTQLKNSKNRFIKKILLGPHAHQITKKIYFFIFFKNNIFDTICTSTKKYWITYIMGPHELWCVLLFWEHI